MKQRFITLFLALCTIFSFSAFSACDDDTQSQASEFSQQSSSSFGGSQETHTHTYTWEFDGIKHWRGCACGEKEEQELHQISTKGDCSICGATSGTEGLEYTLSNDETYYICSDIGSVTVGDIVVGDIYNGLLVKQIGESAFYGCKSLESIVIPDGLTSIGDMAFYNCKNLKSVTIPDGVTVIGNFMCYGCSSLESIEISNKITSIGNYAFTDCKSIKNIVIPKDVTSIGVSAFFWCNSLTNVYYMGTENDWNIISIDSDNAKLKSAKRYYYSDSQPADVGNYWHYIDGVPTVW